MRSDVEKSDKESDGEESEVHIMEYEGEKDGKKVEKKDEKVKVVIGKEEPCTRCTKQRMKCVWDGCGRTCVDCQIAHVKCKGGSLGFVWESRVKRARTRELGRKFGSGWGSGSMGVGNTRPEQREFTRCWRCRGGSRRRGG